MKQLFAVLSAAAILVSAAPAFACGGDKAKKDHSTPDDTITTATEDGADKGDKEKAKKTKKEDTEEAQEQEGEV